MTELPEPKQFGDYGDWPGRAVLDNDGERIGKVREIYLDDATDRPEWVLIDRDDGEPRFVPLVDATVEQEAIRVASSSQSIEAAPALEPTKQLTQDQERELYSHYGVPLSEEASDSLLPVTDGEPESAAETTPEREPAAEPEPAAAAPTPVPEPPTTTDPPVAAAGPTTELNNDGPAELPAAGQTSEPEDTGPMVPPRPEPVAPDPVEPPSPSALDKVRERNVPLVAGIAAAIGAALILLVRRRRS